jgi:hypothetical protein
VFADASLVEAHAPLAIERDKLANPKAGKALLRRLPMEERFGMAQFSHLLGHTERSPTELVKTNDGSGGYADPGGRQAFGQAGSRL